MKKTTKKEFNEFIKEFKRMQSLLNLGDWDLTFKMDNLEEVANISWNPEGRIAIVTLCDRHSGLNTAKVARHEAWHLFYSALEDSAKERFVQENHIDVIVEKMCTIMEKYDLEEAPENG